MNKIKNMSLFSKLAKKRGDTLVEALAAILIVSLSTALLLSAAASASNANKMVLTADEKYKTELERAEEMTESSGTGTVTITKTGFSKNIDVTFYGEENELISFKASSSGGGE